MNDYANDDDYDGDDELPAVGILVSCDDELDAEIAWTELTRLGFDCRLWRRPAEAG